MPTINELAKGPELIVIVHKSLKSYSTVLQNTFKWSFPKYLQIKAPDLKPALSTKYCDNWNNVVHPSLSLISIIIVCAIVGLQEGFRF